MKLKLSLIALFVFIAVFVGGFIFAYYADVPIEKKTISKDLPSNYFTSKMQL